MIINYQDKDYDFLLNAKCVLIHEYNYLCTGNPKDLELNKVYEVTELNMGHSSTDIGLKGVKGSFTSVYFEFYHNNKKVNIFKSKKFNPYSKILKLEQEIYYEGE